MSTEIASLLVTAEAQTQEAERALDRLGIKYDQTVERMRGASGKFVSFTDANKLAAKEIRNHGQAIDELRGKLQSGAADLQRFGAYLTAGVTLPLIGGAAAATKFAGDLQSSVSLIRTIRPDFDASAVFDKLSILQTRIPQTSAQLGEAAYNIVSSLDDIGEAATLNLTEKFGKGATAARTDALAFGTAILGVLNAYKLKVTDVDHVQDLFFQTVNRGIITGSELAGELASVSKAAQNAGVDLDTLMALVVGATKEAGPAAENMTQLSQVLNQFTSKEAQKGLKGLGIATHDAHGQFLPFIGVLDQVKARYDKLSEVDKSKLVQGLFPDIRSQKGFATLLRELDSVKAAKGDTNTAGAADRAFETVSKTFNFQFEIFKNTVRHAFESIGAELLPVLVPILKSLGELLSRGVHAAVEAWKTMPSGVKAALASLAGLAAAAGPVLVVLGTLAAAAIGVAGSIASIVTAVGAAGGLAALSEILLPVAAVISAVIVLLGEFAAVAAAVGAAIYAAWSNNFLGIRDLTYQAWGGIKTFVLEVWQELQSAYALIMPELQQITQTVLGVIQAFWTAHGQKIVAAVKLAWSVITTVVKTAVRVVASVIAGVLAIINGDWQKAWDMAVRACDTFWSGVASIMVKVLVTVNNAINQLIAFLIVKAVQFYQAGQELALKLVAAIVAEIWNGAPRIIAAVVGVAAMLSNPGVLAAYAAAGVAQARARNEAFEANLNVQSTNANPQRDSDTGEYVSPGSRDWAPPASSSGAGGPGSMKLPGGGGGKGGGESALKKLYKLQLEDLATTVSAIERLNQRALGDAEYFYSEGLSTLDAYVTARRAANEKLFAAEQQRDQKEQEALNASGLKGREKEVEQNKLNEKIAANTQKHEVGITEIERYAAAQRQEIHRAAWQGQLDLLNEVQSGFDEAYQRMADQGVLSFAKAQSAIDNGHMELLLSEKVGIERELARVVKGTKQYTDLSNQLDMIEQRIENFRAHMLASGEDATRKDVDSLNNYTSQIRSAYETIASLEMDNSRDRLRILEQMGAGKQVVWKREMELDLQAAQVAAKRRVEDLERQRDYVTQFEKNEERRLGIIKSINDQIAAEEGRAAQERANITAEYYEKQRERLRDWANKAVDTLKTALNKYRDEGIKGFFKSLGESFRDMLEQMALDLLRARVLSLLQTVFKIPQVGKDGTPTEASKGGGGIFETIKRGLGLGGAPQDQAAATATPIVNQVRDTGLFTVQSGDQNTNAVIAAIGGAAQQISEAVRSISHLNPELGGDNAFASSGADSFTGMGISGLFSGLLHDVFHVNGAPSKSADASAISRAGHAATGAIKDGWEGSKTEIGKVGDTQSKVLTTVGQGIVSTMLQIASVIANGNTAMGFWKGLLLAAGTAAIGSIISGFKPGGDGGGGKDGGGGGGTEGKAAAGGFFTSKNGGRFINVAEGGYDEVVLTTDPSQRGRMANLMAAYMAKTGMHSYAQGGFISGFVPPPMSSVARAAARDGKRNVNVYLTQEIHTNSPEAFQRTARQNARAARGALTTVMNQ